MSALGLTQDRGKGILGIPPPRFPPKDNLAMSPMTDLGHLGTHSRASTINTMGWGFQLDYPQFDGVDF